MPTNITTPGILTASLSTALIFFVVSCADESSPKPPPGTQDAQDEPQKDAADATTIDADVEVLPEGPVSFCGQPGPVRLLNYGSSAFAAASVIRLNETQKLYIVTKDGPPNYSTEVYVGENCEHTPRLIAHNIHTAHPLPDGRILALSCTNNTAHIFDPKNNYADTLIAEQINCSPFAVYVSSQGIAFERSNSNNDWIDLLTITATSSTPQVIARQLLRDSIRLEPNSARLYARRAPHELVELDWHGEPPTPIKNQVGEYWPLPDREHLLWQEADASGTRYSAVYAHHIETGTDIYLFEKYFAEGLTWTPDARFAATLRDTGALGEVIHIADGTPVHVPTHLDGEAVFHDGFLLSVPVDSNTLSYHRWSPATNTMTELLRGPSRLTDLRYQITNDAFWTVLTDTGLEPSGTLWRVDLEDGGRTQIASSVSRSYWRLFGDRALLDLLESGSNEHILRLTMLLTATRHTLHTHILGSALWFADDFIYFNGQDTNGERSLWAFERP